MNNLDLIICYFWMMMFVLAVRVSSQQWFPHQICCYTKYVGKRLTIAGDASPNVPNSILPQQSSKVSKNASTNWPSLAFKNIRMSVDLIEQWRSNLLDIWKRHGFKAYFQECWFFTSSPKQIYLKFESVYPLFPTVYKKIFPIKE